MLMTAALSPLGTMAQLRNASGKDKQGIDKGILSRRISITTNRLVLGISLYLTWYWWYPPMAMPPWPSISGKWPLTLSFEAHPARKDPKGLLPGVMTRCVRQPYPPSLSLHFFTDVLVQGTGTSAHRNDIIHLVFVRMYICAMGAPKNWTNHARPILIHPPLPCADQIPTTKGFVWNSFWFNSSPWFYSFCISHKVYICCNKRTRFPFYQSIWLCLYCLSLFIYIYTHIHTIFPPCHYLTRPCLPTTYQSTNDHLHIVVVQGSHHSYHLCAYSLQRNTHIKPSNLVFSS